ncbi:MAG: FKBP-type peptidyl-prolyl cis-trans isomerase, partial [Oscillospiraceae bacterium]|nr:FKBP-type peptidyl-prolyl cis-trans isomerase [Oscillospiraceae bacterium]
MAFTYRGLTAEYTRHIVTSEEVDKNMHRLMEQNPRIAEVTDRPTENGDEVILDYAGFCDGEQFPGGTAENQTLVLGSGMFIPGFEEQLLDKVPGQEVMVEVTFPQQYHAENLAGKAAQFQCKIKAIRVKTPYELDDTFAKEVGH